MIDPAELKAKAAEFGTHVANVQRDYVFGWLIFGIFTVSALRDTIFLKGGNAIRKGYFANTRYSSDLDFGIPDDIEQETLLAEINNVCEFARRKASVKFVTEDNQIEEKFTAAEAPIPGLKVYEIRVYFRAFEGRAEHLKLRISMDITRFDKVMLPLQTVSLIHQFSDTNELGCEIRCMKLEEIVATKLKCLMQRQHAPDLYDYAYSIKLLGGDLNKEEVVRAFMQKTIFEMNPHVAKRILRQTSLDYFREYWDKTLICAKQFILGVEEAIQVFLDDLESLFTIFPDTGYQDFAFFGAELRVPILQAGREQTLLKIRYNGSDRLVEPYSLKYMQKKDGEQREYFYVYNLSGGASEPGPRSLLANGFESIENTDQKFAPRFPIELSKAGEMPENHLLFDPNRPLKAPRIRSAIRRPARRVATRVFGQIKHVFRCSYCNKKSVRNSYDSTRRDHKDKDGYPCHGFLIYEGPQD